MSPIDLMGMYSSLSVPTPVRWPSGQKESYQGFSPDEPGSSDAAVAPVASIAQASAMPISVPNQRPRGGELDILHTPNIAPAPPLPLMSAVGVPGAC